LNRFKLQGNIWHGESQRSRADVVVAMALPGGAAALDPTGDGGRLPVVVIHRWVRRRIWSRRQQTAGEQR